MSSAGRVRWWWFVVGALALVATFGGGALVGYRRGLPAWKKERRPPDPGAHPGSVNVCVDKKTSAPKDRDVEKGLSLHGMVVGLGDARHVTPLREKVVPCHGEPAHYFDIEDESHDLWRVRYSHSGVHVEPSLHVGAPVTLRLRANLGFETAAGFVLLDDAGVILAVEKGTFGPGLYPADEAPFSVGQSDVSFIEPTECGDLFHYALVVFADKKAYVPPEHTADLTMAGKPYGFWNEDSNEYFDVNCTDTFGGTGWALWRK